MNALKKRAINDLAEKLIEVLELELPIPIEKVPSMLGGKLKECSESEMNNMEAMIKKDGKDSFVICISEARPINRKRFSIAHELGHLFLHMGYLIRPEIWEKEDEYKDSVYYRYGYNKEELEANEFAGAFLMPKKEFKVIAKQYLNNSYYDLEAIAKKFNVSTEAVKIRGRQLGMFSWE